MRVRRSIPLSFVRYGNPRNRMKQSVIIARGPPKMVIDQTLTFTRVQIQHVGFCRPICSEV